jgi:hypothetical protein
MRSMYPPRLDRRRGQDRFGPVADGGCDRLWPENEERAFAGAADAWLDTTSARTSGDSAAQAAGRSSAAEHTPASAS